MEIVRPKPRSNESSPEIRREALRQQLLGRRAFLQRMSHLSLFMTAASTLAVAADPAMKLLEEKGIMQKRENSQHTGNLEIMLGFLVILAESYVMYAYEHNKKLVDDDLHAIYVADAFRNPFPNTQTYELDANNELRVKPPTPNY